MDIKEVLHTIQKNLKAPKNQLNKFGNYKYRSCEDIVEAVKSIMPEGVTLKLSDDIVMIGERYYVKATALLCYGSTCEIATAYARESEDKKGMDAAQVTGATSSYARKYALNGLFMIDDTKDADTDEHAETVKAKVKEPEVKMVDGAEFVFFQGQIKEAETLDQLKDEWTKIHLSKVRMTDQQYSTLEKIKNARKTQLEPVLGAG